MASFRGKKGFIHLLLEYSFGILLILSAAYMAESLLSNPNKPLERILLLDSANGVSDNSTPPENSSQTNMTDNSTNATVANGNFTENPSENNTNATAPEIPANVTNQTELPPEQNATENITENNTNPLIPLSAINKTTSENTGNVENITYTRPSNLIKGEIVKYTPTSETHCIKGTCVATLYPTRNFIQDRLGKWKRLGEITNITYSNNLLNISWNTRSILLQPYIRYNGSYTEQLPSEYNFSISYTNFIDYIEFKPRIKFVDGLTEFGFKKVSWSNDEVVINFDDLAANNFEVTQNETHISIRNLEGRVSSNEMLELDPTITLNESNSGNVGDSFTNSSDTGVNYGTLLNLSVRSYTSGDVRRVFLLFNLSVIPSSATITDANLSLYMFVAPSNSRTYSAYNTSNSWTETGITQSNQPAADTLQQGVTVTTPASVWKSWNVTNAAVSSYAQTNKNMSIMIRDNTETATTARFALFVSKENTTDTSKRPQLIITYVTPPTYSDNSTSSTLANTNVEHRLKWQSETGLSGYIFSFCNGTYQKATITLNPTTTYTFLDNTSNNAYWASPVNPITSPAGGTEATAVQYTNMSLNDSSFARVLGDATNNDDPYWSMNFTINETTASINWINVSLGGFKVLTGGSEAATCYVFNWTSVTWLSISTLGTTPTIISSNYTAGIGDIVNASTKVLNVYCTGAQFDLNEGIYLDFVSVVVNSSNTTYSTANCSDANAVLTNDSWVAMTGTLDWSNVTKLITSTEEATVKWCVYANNTGGAWNSTSCSNPFVYLTTAQVVGFTITLPGQNPVDAAEEGNATADIEFNLTGGNTASNVAPCIAATSTCQTSGTPIFVFTNTGTATLSWYVYLDTNMPASMTLKGKTNNDPAGATTITTTGWLVASSIAPSNSQNAWLWTDFTGAKVSDATSRTLKNNATST